MFQMFKRSGALSGTRRTSKKPSPLPKRGTKKELENIEKGSDKALGKKTSLPDSTEYRDEERKCENELTLESMVDCELEMDQQAIDGNAVVHHSEDHIQSSNSDSMLRANSASSHEKEATIEEINASQNFEEVGVEIDQSPLDVSKEQLHENIEVDLKLNEEMNVRDSKMLGTDGKDATSFEGAKLEGDLLIDAEDSETFQDLQSKPDIASERNTDDPKTLEMKSSDTSGLVSGGVISLQYPEDDTKSKVSVPVNCPKAEDQIEDKVLRLLPRIHCNMVLVLLSLFAI